MRSPGVARTLDGVVEACWLLALIAVPLYFDTLTSRIFEPDKIVLFRNITLVMVAFMCLRGRLWLGEGRGRVGSSESEGGRSLQPSWWRREASRRPMIIPVLLFFLVYTAATIASALPRISFWGSYDRMQGLYTWLNYGVLFFVLCYRVRTWGQIERVTNAIIFTSLPIAFYGILQKFGLDPITWGGDTQLRVASTLGNSIFLGAYLLMCVPFVVYRLWRSVDRARAPILALPLSSRRRGGTVPSPAAPSRGRARVSIVIYSLILLADIVAMYFDGSRGPYYGLIVAVFVMGLIVTIKTSQPRPAVGAILVCIAFFVFPYALNSLGQLGQSSHASASPGAIGADTQHLTTLSDADSRVRVYIWQGSIPLILQRPLLGWGPETMLYVYSPYYPSGLGHLEHSNAAPDRNHDEWFDFLVFSGVIGLAAWLAVLALFAATAYRALRLARSTRSIVFIAAVVAATLGHLAEASVGIDIVSTLILLWVMFALATVLLAHPHLLHSSVDVQDTGARDKSGPRANGSARSRRDVATSQADLFYRFAVLGALLVIGVGEGALFVNNSMIVHADYLFKQGQQGEQVSIQCLSGNAAQCPGAGPGGQAPSAAQLQRYGGEQVLPQAIGFLQQASLEQTDQDMYDLWLAKAYQEQGNYYLSIENAATPGAAAPSAMGGCTQGASPSQLRSCAVQQFMLSQDAFLRAMALNPYNADHPAGLARLYVDWATFDASKWPEADRYFRAATLLARHNGRLADEWGQADLTQAQQSRPSASRLLAGRRRAILTQALAIFQHACDVDNLLGDARAYRGETYALLNRPRLAAASYSEALRVGGFELYSVPAVDRLLVNLLKKEGDTAALGRPIVSGNPPVKVYGDQTPETLEYSPTAFEIALANGQFQRLGGLQTLEGLILALGRHHDYRGLTSPIVVGGRTLYGGLSPLALARNTGLNGVTSTFSKTLQLVSEDVQRHGYTP